MAPLADPTLVKLLGGLVVSTFLTVGGLAYNNKSTNDTQTVRIDHLESNQAAIQQLSEQLAITNTNLAILNERIQNLKEKLDEQSK